MTPPRESSIAPVIGVGVLFLLLVASLVLQFFQPLPEQQSHNAEVDRLTKQVEAMRGDIRTMTRQMKVLTAEARRKKSPTVIVDRPPAVVPPSPVVVKPPPSEPEHKPVKKPRHRAHPVTPKPPNPSPPEKETCVLIICVRLP